MESKDMLCIRGLSAIGFHGIFDAERQEGQKFKIDADLYLDKPVCSDDITQSVDYAKLSGEIVNIITGDPVNLIESLAQRIACHCLSYSLVAEAKITVHKPFAPMPFEFEDVSITICRSKNESSV